MKRPDSYAVFGHKNCLKNKKRVMQDNAFSAFIFSVFQENSRYSTW